MSNSRIVLITAGYNKLIVFYNDIIKRILRVC